MSEPIYTVYTTRFTDDAEHAFVKSFEVDYTVPEHFDPRPTLIAALETELQLEMAKSEKTCTELRGKIANLLALGQS